MAHIPPAQIQFMMENRQRNPSGKPEHPKNGIKRQDSERVRGPRSKTWSERKVEHGEESEEGDEEKKVDL